MSNTQAQKSGGGAALSGGGQTTIPPLLHAAVRLNWAKLQTSGTVGGLSGEGKLCAMLSCVSELTCLPQMHSGVGW